jgi:hypothetical protein
MCPRSRRFNLLAGQLCFQFDAQAGGVVLIDISE